MRDCMYVGPMKDAVNNKQTKLIFNHNIRCVEHMLWHFYWFKEKKNWNFATSGAGFGKYAILDSIYFACEWGQYHDQYQITRSSGTYIVRRRILIDTQLTTHFYAVLIHFTRFKRLLSSVARYISISDTRLFFTFVVATMHIAGHLLYRYSQFIV